MAEEYISNIQIAGLTLTLNPEQYSPKFKKYGSYKRTIGGGINEIDINGKKLVIDIKALTQTQIDDIRKRCALNKKVNFIDFVPISEKDQQTNKKVNFIDFVPISEKDQQTRTVYEDLGSETIDSETIYTYIPTYKIMIFNFIPVFVNNVMEYTISGEEI